MIGQRTMKQRCGDAIIIMTVGKEYLAASHDCKEYPTEEQLPFDKANYDVIGAPAAAA